MFCRNRYSTIQASGTYQGSGVVLAVVAILAWLNAEPILLSQSFKSGSNGSDGALNLTTPGVVYFDPKSFNPPLNPAGDNIFNFTTINIGTGVTVILSSRKLSGPVYWLAQGAVQISGTISLDGEAGLPPTDNTSDRYPAFGGAGGYAGGTNGKLGSSFPPLPGSGPGGGAAGTSANGVGTGGSFTGNQFLVPLVGGSGGGADAGGTACGASALYGGGGGGGGGALLLASSTSITFTSGAISAAGGGNRTCLGGGGAGGAIRLMAPIISGSGVLRVTGGNPSGGNFQGAANGRIRIEAFQANLSGIQIFGPSSQSAPFAVALPATPPPSIKVTSVAGIAINANPFSFPDATINQAAPVTVNIEAHYIPVGTVPKLYIFSETGSDQVVTATALQGNLQGSTANVQVTFPTGGSRGFVKATW